MMSTSVGCCLFLQYNKHFNIIGEQVRSSFQGESNADAKIVCDGGVIKVHRLVLASASPWLKTLFEEVPPSSDPYVTILIPDVKYSDLVLIIKFIYGGEVTVPLKQLGTLKDLIQLLQLNPGHVIETIIEKSHDNDSTSSLAMSGTMITQISATCVGSPSNQTKSSGNILSNIESLHDPFAVQVEDVNEIVIETNNDNEEMNEEPKAKSQDLSIAANNSHEVRAKINLNFENLTPVTELTAGLSSSSEQQQFRKSERLKRNNVQSPSKPKPKKTRLNTTKNTNNNNNIAKPSGDKSKNQQGVANFAKAGVIKKPNTRTKTPHLQIIPVSGILRCSLCHTECSSYDDYKKHENLVHQPNFSCQDCRKGFFSRWNYIAHLRTHTGEKPFVCSFCKANFRQKAHLIKHFSSVHRFQNSEKKREKSGKKSNNLPIEQNSESTEPAGNPGAKEDFSCCFCGENFENKESIRRHISQVHRDLVT